MSRITLDLLPSSNNIRRELIHGKNYRLGRNYVKTPIIHPVSSPADISVFPQRKRKVNRVGDFHHPKSSSLITQNRRQSKSVPIIKNSFWERAKLTHKQYTDVLSTPHLSTFKKDENVNKFRSKTMPNICPPRLIKMAHPNKRRILGTWQDHGDHLPQDAVHRLRELLQPNEESVEMKAVHQYFKKRDSKQRQRRKKLLKRKKKYLEYQKWLKNQTEETADAILRYLCEEPEKELNFKQLLVSDVLLNVLAQTKKRRDPILRHTGNQFNKELVKMVDKMAVWIDSVSKIADIQDLEFIEKEEEEEESYLFPDASPTFSITSTSMKLGRKLDRDQSLQELEPDTDLIHLLSKASEDYLSKKIDEMEDVTRNQILDKIKALNRNFTKEGEAAEVFKSILFDWAMHSDPSKVNSDMIEDIAKVAGHLSAMLEEEDVDNGMHVKGAGEHPRKRRQANAEDRPATADFDEDEAPKPGTLTEIVAEDGTVQMGVVDKKGDVQPVIITPSGNLRPIVFDKKGKIVDKLFDKEGNQLEIKFNKHGVPEPVSYDDELFDDEKNPIEVIYNEKGRKIPQSYDKDGKPIPAMYDENGKPLRFGEDGNSVPITREEENAYKTEIDDIYRKALEENKKAAAGEGKPGEGKPGGGKPGESKPGEGKPGEGKPGEGKPGEGKPGEGKPGEGKPGEGKPGEVMAGEGIAGEVDAEKDKGDVRAIKREDDQKQEGKDVAAELNEKDKKGTGSPSEEKTDKESLKTESEGMRKIVEDEKKAEKSGEADDEENIKSEDLAKVKDDEKNNISEGYREPSTTTTEDTKKAEGKDEAKDADEESSESKKEGKESEGNDDVNEEEGKPSQEQSDENVERTGSVSKEKTSGDASKETVGRRSSLNKQRSSKDTSEQKLKSEEGKSSEVKVRDETNEDQEKEDDSRKGIDSKSRGDLRGDTEEESRKNDEEERKLKKKIKKRREGRIEGPGKESEKSESSESESGSDLEAESVTESGEVKKKLRRKEAKTDEIKKESEQESGDSEDLQGSASMITVIKRHAPMRTYEHSKDAICCLSLKIWAIWLLEIVHNAHNWTKWITSLIEQIRVYAATLRGEMFLPNGQKKVLFKDDWNNFLREVNENAISWRQYSKHVQDLTDKIIKKFHGKNVQCCEKCLEDNLIKNVVSAHATMRSLTEALNCAGYWQRCLDEIVKSVEQLEKIVIKERPPSVDSDEHTGWSYSSSSRSSSGNDDYYDCDGCFKIDSRVKFYQWFPRCGR